MYSLRNCAATCPVVRMSSIALTLTERYRGKGEAVAVRLRQYIPVDEPRYLLRKAVGDFPQFISLLADQATWVTAIGAVALPFLARVGYRLAEATIDKIESLFKTNESTVLIETARALAKSKQEGGTGVSIKIGLTVPSERTPTYLTITDDDPARIAFALALFAAKAGNIADAMRREANEQCRPATEASLEILAGGGMLARWQYWTEDHKLENREILIP